MDICASNWNEADAGNGAPVPDGAPEGMAPSGVNDVLRAHQGAVKRWYNWTVPKLTAGTISGGVCTAYTLTYGVAPGALVDGMVHEVRFHAPNGSNAILNVNALGSLPLYSYQGDGWAQVSAGVINADAISRVSYNALAGAYFLLDVGESTPYTVVKTGTNVSSIDFRNIPAGMNHVHIDLDATVATNNVNLLMQFYMSDGTLDTDASAYSWGMSITPNNAGAVATNGQLVAAAIIIANGMSNSVNIGCSGVIDIENIQASKFTQATFRNCWQEQTQTLIESTTGQGTRLAAGPITGIRIVSSSGNIGTYRATLTARS
jgi:hypothetical protein